MSFCAELSIPSKKFAEIFNSLYFSPFAAFGAISTKKCRFVLSYQCNAKNLLRYLTDPVIVTFTYFNTPSMLVSSYVAVSMVCCFHATLPVHLGLLPT